jgi:hypothetical protein
MATGGKAGQNGRGKLKVTELSADCLRVGLAPTGGWRATLSVNIEIEGPDGQRYRGAGSRLHVRVYPIKPAKGEAASSNGHRSGGKRKVGAAR